MLPLRAVLPVSLLAMILSWGPSRLAAQAEGHAHVEGAAVETEAEDWHAHPNHLLGFLGATLDSEESAFTVGLDYTRQVTQRVSVGAFADYAAGGLRESIVGAMVVAYPYRGLYLEVAPAAAVEDGEWHYVQRFGAGWEFEFGNLLVGPYAAIDVASGRKPLYVLGAAAGVHF